MSEEGYLVCENCKGYYELQKGEKASDFDLCECGGFLVFQIDLYNISNHSVTEETPPEKEVIKYPKSESEKTKISESAKNKAEKRKELFEELSKEAHLHEDLLDIKDGKISSEEVTGNLRDADNQMMVSNILTNESLFTNNSQTSSNIKAEENKLIGQINEKRSSVRESDKKTSLSGSNIKIIIVLVVILVVAGVFLLFFK